MNEFDILEKIKQNSEKTATDYKLKCYKAFEIAKEFSIKINEIGQICNKNGIKITSCQLGCFN